MTKAVISIDYINSSKWGIKQREAVTYLLTQELTSSQNIRFEFYRGDSLQIVCSKPHKALELALVLKTSVNKLTFEEEGTKKINADIRISIGIGDETLQKDLVGQSTGTAYEFSGRRLDTMKTAQRLLCITTGKTQFNAEFEVSAQFFEEIARRWSTASAEAVYYSLKGYKEIPLSKLLSIGQPAVNKRKKVAGWHCIEIFINRFEKAVKHQFQQ